MRQNIFKAVKPVHITATIEVTTKSLSAFRRRFPAARIQTINAIEVVETCESCSEPILSGQKYNRDEDGVSWHKRCPKKGKP